MKSGVRKGVRKDLIAHGVHIRRGPGIYADYYLRGAARLWYRRPDGTRIDVPTLAPYADPTLAAERR